MSSSPASSVVIGSGAHRYEWIDQWGKLPPGYQFGTTHGVTEDSQGRIFIHHTGSPSIFVFDPEGNFLGACGEAYAEGGHGMFYNREGNDEFLYLSPTSLGFVAKVTLDGKEVLRIGTPPRPDIYNGDRRFVPTETAVASTGEIYIADGYGQPWVHRYSPGGKYIDSFGGAGSEPGKLSNVHGIRIDRRSGEELMIVADRGNNRLEWFTLEGKFVREVKGMLYRPCNAQPVGELVYIPDLDSRLTILDREDKLVLHLGDRPGCSKTPGWPNLPPEDWIVGQFSSPHDLHVDGSGNIYVAEWLSNGTGKLTKLVKLPD